MTPVEDDVAIRTALAELTEGQPPAPFSRFEAVRQRAVRHRRRQLAVAALSVVVTAGVAVGIVGLPGLREHPPTTRHVPTWALDWPDHRNDSVPKSVLDRAVVAYQLSYAANGGESTAANEANNTVLGPGASAAEVAHAAARYPLVWYVGQTMDHGQVVVVMFEMAAPAGRMLVVGLADSSEVMQNQAAWQDATSPWVFSSIPAPNPKRPPMAVGEFATGQDPVSNPDQNPDNWMVVLTAPDVQRMTWTVPTTSGVRSPTVRTSDGLVAVDTGQVTAPVLITKLLTAQGNALSAPMQVGLPGHPSVPQLAALPALAEPRSFKALTGGSGQGDFENADSTFSAGHKKYEMFGACYGPRPLAIQVNGHAIGTMSCNSQLQQLSVPAGLLRGHKLDVWVQTSNWTEYRVDFGSLR